MRLLKDREAESVQTDSSQQAWRAKATQAVLLVLVAAGLPLVLLAVTSSFVALPGFGRLVSVAVWLALLLALLLRQAHYRTRALILLTALYALTATQLAVSGLVGQGRVSLVLLPVLTMVLLGLRAGWMAFSVSALLMAAAVALSSAGALERWQTIREGDVTPRYWGFQGLNLLAPLITVMILLTEFVRLQARTMAAERRTRLELEDEIDTRRQCEAEIARVAEDERRKLGSELHDGLCQQLTAALLQCTAVESLLVAKRSPEAGLVGRLRHMVEEAIGTSYDVSKGLCPVDLDPEGLVSALERLARQTRDISGIPCEIRSEGHPAIRDPQAALYLFRIAQEAIKNAVRHARCRHIQIELLSAAGTLILRVCDDGIGRASAAGTSPGGMGLRLMAHRAEVMGGAFAVEQPAGGGTAVTCRVPLEPAREASA